MQLRNKGVFRLSVGRNLPKIYLVSIYEDLRGLFSHSRTPNVSRQNVLARKKSFSRFLPRFLTESAILLMSAKGRDMADIKRKSTLRRLQIKAKTVTISKMYRLLGLKSSLHQEFVVTMLQS